MKETPSSELEDEISRNEKFAEYGAWAVVAGLVAEIIVAFLAHGKAPVFDATSEKVADVIATGLIALGVIAEIHFGRKSRIASNALQSISEEKVAEANLRAAEAARLAESEKLERLKLVAAVSPRTLSGEQQKSIAESLKSFAKKNVRVISYVDVDSANLLLQIDASFKRAGLDSRREPGGFSPIGGFAVGIHVAGTDQQLVGAIVTSLSTIGNLPTIIGANAFNVAGMKSELANAPMEAWAASVLVGLKHPTTIA